MRACRQSTASSNAPNSASDSSSTSPSINVHANAAPSPSHPIQTVSSPAMNQPALSPTGMPHLFSLVSDTVRSPGSYSQHDSGFDVWPPYYPPESYPIPSSSLSPSHSFRIPSPEIITVSPAPFHFSSSSLSAALSAPPQLHRPLPPISSELPLMEPRPETELPSDNALNVGQNGYDNPMTLGDPLAAMASETIPADHLPASHFPPAFTSSPLLQPQIASNAQHSSMPISPISHSSAHFHPLYDSWKSPTETLSDLLISFEYSPQSNSDNTLLADPGFEDLSSAASTPLSVAPSVSPISSPNVSSPVNLPGGEQLMTSTSSLLFSTPLEPARSHVFSTQGLRPTSATKRLLKSDTPMRLSSSLPLTTEWAALYLFAPFEFNICMV